MSITPDNYTIFFNSRGSNVINNTSLNAVQYFVNWDNILNKKYNKYDVSFTFKSENFNGSLTDNGFVNINCGMTQCYDGVSPTQNLGIIYPNSLLATSSFYNSTNNDNNNITISYPVNNTITVSLKTLSGVNMGNMPNYCLVLTLTGIQ